MDSGEYWTDVQAYWPPTAWWRPAPVINRTAGVLLPSSCCSVKTIWYDRSLSRGGHHRRSHGRRRPQRPLLSRLPCLPRPGRRLALWLLVAEPLLRDRGDHLPPGARGPVGAVPRCPAWYGTPISGLPILACPLPDSRPAASRPSLSRSGDDHRRRRRSARVTARSVPPG